MRVSARMLPLPARLFLGTALFVFVSAAVAVYLILDFATDVYRADRGAVAAYRAERRAQDFTLAVEQLRREIRFLAAVPPVQGVRRAIENGGVDPVEGIPAARWTERLQEIFVAFADLCGNCLRVSLMDGASGRELVTVTGAPGGAVVSAPGSGGAAWEQQEFRRALDLPPGAVRISDVQLQWDNGVALQPPTHSLWLGTPIGAPGHDTPFGVLAVLIDAGSLISAAVGDLPPGMQAYLMNGAGDFLVHPDPARMAGPESGRRRDFRQDLPGLVIPAQSGQGSTRPPQAIHTPDGRLHMVIERMHIDATAPERDLLLAYALPEKFVALRMRDLRVTAWLLALAFAVAVAGLFLLFLRRSFAPLSALTRAADAISSGRFDISLPQGAGGEVATFTRAFSVMLDNLRRRESELHAINTELRHSESRLNTVVENLAEGVAVFDLDGRLLHFNRAALEMHGFDGMGSVPGELSRLASLFELADADGHILPTHTWPVARILHGETLHEVEIRVRRTDRDWQRTFTYGGALAREADGRPLLAVVTIRDITQRKLIEAAVREGQERYRTLFNTLLEGFCIIEVLFDADEHPVDYRFLEINSAFERQTGLHNARGKCMKEFAPDHERHWFETFGRVALTGEPVRFVNEALALNRWFDVSAYRIGGPESHQVAILFNDITELKQAEQRNRLQLEHLNLLDHITRAIGERQDLNSIFQVVVRSLEDSLPVDFGCVCLYEAAADELRVTSIGVKGADLAAHLAMEVQSVINVDRNGLARCVRGELVYEPDIGVVDFPFPARLARAGLGSLVLAPLRSESRVFGVLVAARRISRGFSSLECEFLRQLSEHVALAAHHAQLYAALQQAYDDLRQTQQVVMQEERLRALGQMASGIAHDINNALSPVSLYTESMLETEKNLSDRARGYLQTILRAVQDVAQTVARMREFYRQRELQLELAPVDLNQMAQQVLDLTRARWSDQALQHGIVIRAQAELGPGLPRVMGVESEIREALTNLVFNAVDAMPEGGVLTLRTRHSGAKPADAVIVEVTDTGIGMAEETRRRCLEPFYTTKGERGTGLGLAMVFGMAQRHSAELEVRSAPGAGTTISIVFGIQPVNPVEPGAADTGRKVPARLRLLLVDDDPVLLKSLRDALELDGHIIVSANGGEAGINTFRAALERGERFAAVITDLGMPYVDGRKVATAVKEASPTTPVVLLTGWGQRLVAEGDIPPHVDRVLAKPPRLREVRDVLAQLCSGASP